MPDTDPLDRAAYVEQVMGMPWSVHVRGPNARRADTAVLVREAFTELHRIDAVFSTYRPDSDVSRIGRGELTLEDADPDLADVHALALLAQQRTNGLFRVHLPDARGRVRFDPSGIVKGWAAERAFAMMRVLPDDVCLNAGGDVVVRTSRTGPEEDRRTWQVGIERPGGGGVLTVLPLDQGAVATSGVGARGAHLVDPRIGRPALALAQVSVTGPSLMWADVLATAAFVRGPDATEWLQAQVGYQGLVVQLDGSLSATPGWPLNG
ncbi:FAD:protein FMN transferase [Angustibacter sp. McL0619]|uniref:FAD:protein FMN transferase n=1 Tax=Angustibacter sp. McL0619 TaxID=3415676 RepID=UPI003CED7266